jgi:hypothetical protein
MKAGAINSIQSQKQLNSVEVAAEKQMVSIVTSCLVGLRQTVKKSCDSDCFDFWTAKQSLSVQA